MELEVKRKLTTKETSKEDTVKKNKKLRYIDRLFKRIFLSSLLLLLLVISDKYIKIRSVINHNFNFLKLTNILVGKTDLVNFKDLDVLVYKKETYDIVTFDGKYNMVENIGTDGVVALTSGVVIKTEKIDNYYNLYIQGIDGLVYGYLQLESIDFHIYDYVSSNTIIGKASYDKESTSFKFKLTIDDNGTYYDYYQKAED